MCLPALAVETPVACGALARVLWQVDGTPRGEAPSTPSEVGVSGVGATAAGRCKPADATVLARLGVTVRLEAEPTRKSHNQKTFGTCSRHRNAQSSKNKVRMVKNASEICGLNENHFIMSFETSSHIPL